MPPARAPLGRVEAEFDLGDAVAGLADALPGAVVAGVRGEADEIIASVRQHRPDVVFNTCEAPLGRPDLEAHVPALLEWLGVPFTGARAETLTVCRKKPYTKALLADAGVPIPLPTGYPCIVKPAAEDGSAYISANSICADESEVAALRARIPVDVIVEEFLPGREFVVSLWGRESPVHSSIGETVFRNDERLITYEAKWNPDSRAFQDTPLSYDTAIDTALRAEILTAAGGAWVAVDARHYLRVDVRLDADGRPRVIDVNPNPELAPEVGICRAVTYAGWTRIQFVRAIVDWARRT